MKGLPNNTTMWKLGFPHQKLMKYLPWSPSLMPKHVREGESEIKIRFKEHVQVEDRSQSKEKPAMRGAGEKGAGDDWEAAQEDHNLLDMS